MTWLRRIIAIPLALTFIALFIPVLIVFRVNDTIGNPDFYTDQLRQANIYHFIYDEVLPAALEEAGSGKDPPDAKINISRIKPHIIDIAQQALPPQWLQIHVEQAINEVLPYVLGDTEGFNIQVPLKDRVVTAAQTIKDTLHQEAVFSDLYDQIVDLILDITAPSLAELPPPFVLSRTEMESIVRTVLPAEWILTQVDDAIDEVLPYLTKDKEQFTVRVNISDRLDDLGIVVTDILKRPETYNYLFENVVAPAIKQNIKAATQLPIGVILTEDEIIPAVKEILPLEWYQTRITDIVGQIMSYLGGTRQTFEVVIPLADRKPAVATVLGRLVDQKLTNQIDSLPPCTAAQLVELLLNPPLDSLPTCRPLNISYSGLKKLLGIDISTILTPFVDMWLPDQWTFTDADLRQALGGEGDEDVLNQAREWVQQGLTYTDEDLRASLGTDYETMENIRQWLADGFTFTEVELRDWIRGGGNGTVNEELQTFDTVRSSLGTARHWKMTAWVIPILLLLSIGALGGRRWSSKLVWAAAVLAIAAIIAYATSGPVFSTIAQPQIDNALMQTFGQAEGFQALIAAKGVTIAQNAIDSFIGGIKSQALGLLVASLVLIVLGSVWHIKERQEE